MAGDRRVRHVRLTTSRQELVHRGAFLLEDALRTASLPEDGRVVFVRSLSLGRMSGHTPRTEVTRRVETGVGDLLARAVHGLHPSAPGSDAVYFRDAVESYASLAAYVATQRPTDAWFWQLVDPRWSPSLSRDESLRALLRSALDTPAGVVAAAEVIRQVERRGALDALLTALRWQDGPPLLAACGWSAAVASTPGHVDTPRPAARHVPRSLSAPGQRTLGRWVRHWGASDARSTWLAGVLLVAERPIRAMDSGLPTAMRALVADVVHETRRESAAQDGTPPADRDAGESTMEVPARDTSPTEMTAASTVAEAGEPRRTPSMERAAAREDVATTVERDASPAAPRRAPTRASGGRSDTVMRGEDLEPTPTAAPAPTKRRPRDETGRPERERGGDAPVHLDRAVVGEVGASRPPSSGAPGASATTTPVPAQSTREDDPPVRHEASRAHSTFHAMDDEHPTAYGGYFFLIPLLTRLHMSAFLDAHPALVDWDLPVRLLARLDRRLGLDERDAVLSIFARHPASEPVGWDGIMTIPESWAPFAASAGRSSGRRQRSGAELVLASWVVVMRRWCRAHAGMGLRALVSRPAHIASTRTHVDVYFALSQVDMRVRLAGLDVNPGWVPWLGRVVQFHYRPGGARDGE